MYCHSYSIPPHLSIKSDSLVILVAIMHRSESTEDSGSTTLYEEERSYDKKKRTPLPWMQLSIVYLIQFAEPITSSVIYPFINQFVRETGITKGDERKTGYFAGLIVRILDSILSNDVALTQAAISLLFCRGHCGSPVGDCFG